MSFFDLFPPPKRMRLAQAGISIDDRSLRFISLNPFRYGEIPLGPGNLPEALTKLKSHGIKFVSAAIPEDKAYIFSTKVESATHKDLADAVAFTVEENAPVKLASSLYAFEYMSEPSERSTTTEATVSVIPLEVAKGYASDFDKAGVTSVSFDLRSEALARALIERGDQKTHLVIDLSDSKCGLCLVEREMVRFSSSVAVDASAHATEAMATLKQELKKVFLFAKDKKIDHITLTGGGAESDAFVAELLNDVDTPYSIGNVWVNVAKYKEKLPEMPFTESLRYAAALGSLLPPSHYSYV